MHRHSCWCHVEVVAITPSLHQAIRLHVLKMQSNALTELGLGEVDQNVSLYVLKSEEA